jgi:hypothetical protein
VVVVYNRMDSDQLANKLNEAHGRLRALTGGARRRKSRASSRGSRKSAKRGSKKGGARRRSRASSRGSRKSSRRGSKKGGARRSRKASRGSSRKSSRRSSRGSRVSRGGKRATPPSFTANLKVQNHIKKQLGVNFSIGIAKLVGKMNDIAKRGLKDEKDYAEKAKRAIEAFDDHLEKQGKAKIIAEIERNNEDARKKRMKK